MTDPGRDGDEARGGDRDGDGGVSAGRDAYVAGGDQFFFNVSVYPGQPGAGTAAGPDEAPAPGPGRRLFSARVTRRPGQLLVAFGAEDSLVITERDTTVHRWSLRGNAPLAGAPASPAAPFKVMRADVGPRVAVSTVAPAVAVTRGARVTLLHFGEAGYRPTTVPLGTSEFLISTDGERFATVDDRGVKVREFADGSVTWRAAGPRSVATATMNPAGTTVAITGAPNMFTGSNRVVVVSRDDPRPREFTFENVPMAGSQVAVSPNGALVAVASFREIVVIRARTGDIIHRRRLSGLRDDVRSSVGTRPHRLICTNQGDLLWLRGRHAVTVNWAGDQSRYLPQDGLCDDIAFDHATSRFAMVSESGQVDVFQWNPGP
ncbi:MAG TPA: hypothetical protein VH478_19535 [Trebonia sp.]|nr:hypothetical protein [Trebonia sp.]